MGKNLVMGGCNDPCENIAYSHISGQESETESPFGKTWCSQADERRGKEYHLEEKEGLQLLRDNSGE
eukprot:11526707-Heterocapsa_arctica.AAC.1